MTEKIDNVDDWIQSLYTHDNEFIVDYAGKKLSFNKRFATKIAFQIREKHKTEEEQAFSIIALLSIQPHFTMEQAAKLPQDLVTKIMLGLEIDPDVLKKKLATTPP